MKYSIEIGKIIEGAMKFDQTKVINYTRQLISKLEEDGETRAATKFNKFLLSQNEAVLSAMGNQKELAVPVDTESRAALADIIYPYNNNIDVILSKQNSESINSFILSLSISLSALASIIFPSLKVSVTLLYTFPRYGLGVLYLITPFILFLTGAV